MVLTEHIFTQRAHRESLDDSPPEIFSMTLRIDDVSAGKGDDDHVEAHVIRGRPGRRLSRRG